MNAEYALTLDGVTKHFGGLRAVDGVALAVRPGERRALIGPNGAGKTTLFNLISGALPVSSGRITLFGRDVTSAPAHHPPAHAPPPPLHTPNLLPDLPVPDNPQLAVQAPPAHRFSMLRPVRAFADLQGRARAMLDSVGLASVAGAMVRNLSHGEQRQLEIALALAG